jgi:hypothetical protein
VLTGSPVRMIRYSTMESKARATPMLLLSCSACVLPRILVFHASCCSSVVCWRCVVIVSFDCRLLRFLICTVYHFGSFLCCAAR